MRAYEDTRPRAAPPTQGRSSLPEPRKREAPSGLTSCGGKERHLAARRPAAVPPLDQPAAEGAPQALTWRSRLGRCGQAKAAPPAPACPPDSGRPRLRATAATPAEPPAPVEGRPREAHRARQEQGRAGCPRVTHLSHSAGRVEPHPVLNPGGLQGEPVRHVHAQHFPGRGRRRLAQHQRSAPGRRHIEIWGAGVEGRGRRGRRKWSFPPRIPTSPADSRIPRGSAPPSPGSGSARSRRGRCCHCCRGGAGGAGRGAAVSETPRADWPEVGGSDPRRARCRERS